MVSRTRSSNLILLYVRFCSMERERCCHEAGRHRTHNGVGSEVGECLAEPGRVRGQGGLKGRNHFSVAVMRVRGGMRSTPERTVLV